jgi:apolipoprotein N-acyltransferase
VRRWSEYFGGYGRGRESIVLQSPVGAVGTLVCYESIFPSLGRAYRRQGAALLANITNDAWFGRTIGPYQHHAHSVLRAIETRLSVVRAANTGISGYIDPLGRVRASTPLFVQTHQELVVERTNVVSAYVRFGDWVGTGALIATLALLAAGWRGRRLPTNGARAA